MHKRGSEAMYILRSIQMILSSAQHGDTSPQHESKVAKAMQPRLSAAALYTVIYFPHADQHGAGNDLTLQQPVCSGEKCPQTGPVQQAKATQNRTGHSIAFAW